MRFHIDRYSIGVCRMFRFLLHAAIPELLPVHCDLIWDICRGVPYRNLLSDAIQGKGTAFFYNLTPRILHRELNKAMKLIGAKNLENVPLRVWGLYDLAWGHPTKRVIPEESSPRSEDILHEGIYSDIFMDLSVPPTLDSLANREALIAGTAEEEANPGKIPG